MSLRVWLPLINDVHNQGASGITVTNTSATFVTGGKIGNAIQFGTAKSYLKLDDVTSFHSMTECSISLWIKILTWNTSYATYFQFGLGTTPWTSYILGLLRNNTASTLCFTIANGSSSTQAGCLTPALDLNAWYHLTFTYKDNHCKIYTNGIETRDYTTQYAPNFAGITNGIIGACNNGSNYQTNCLMNDFRIYDHCLSAAEVREIAQGLVLHYKLDDLENGVLDSSGYGHDGTTLNTVSLSNETCRYSSGISLPNGNSAINCGRGGMMTDSITVNIWLKSSSWANPVSCTEGGGWNFEATGDYFRFPVYISGVGYKYGQSTHTRAQICDNQWHMLTGIYDRINQKVQIYVDGELDNDYAAGTSNNIGYNGSNVIWIGAEASSSATGIASNGMTGLFSDFRIYCTPLSADDILALYHTGAKIDNKANFHTFEINENGTNKLTKTGIMHDNMEESILTLPDGSCWQLLLFHYVDSGNNLFTTSNAINCNDFGLFSRLKDIDKFKIGTQYEFYGIQDGNTYRWIQTNAPLTTTAVTGFSAVNGYTSPGAGLCKCNGNTVLARTNTTSNWWNAVGCYTKYNGGIPGYAQTICKEYIALYARIEKADVKISNQTLNASEIIEL